jgi:hypothetical protein
MILSLLFIPEPVLLTFQLFFLAMYFYAISFDADSGALKIELGSLHIDVLSGSKLELSLRHSLNVSQVK